MNRLCQIVVLALPFALLAGCSNTPAEPKTYALKGKVEAVDVGMKTVKINHEEIPGFMKAMTMNFAVEDSKLLDGLAAGDVVEGKLKVDSGKNTLTELRKLASVKIDVIEADEIEIKANLAKLSAEDRKLAEAQRMCPEGCRLGDPGMGVPIKLMIDGEPVFIGCKGCVRAVEKDPEGTLKKVAALKKK